MVAQQTVIVRLSSEITSYAREIDSLRALVAKLQRMLFGHSSEKNREKIEKKIAQAEKRITELQNRLGEAHSQLTSIAGDIAPKASDSPTRKALPATLPRDKQVIASPETECPVCNGKLKSLGDSISEQLDIINTAFRVNETVRPKLAAVSTTVSCRHRCHRNPSGIVTPVRACCPVSLWRSSLNICHCTAKLKSTPGRAWN